MEEIVFFKQKTAYEMRISDWSSDVCSSDLNCPGARSWTGASTRADFSRSEQAEARTSVRRMATQRPWNTILPTINLLQQPAANACHCGPATPMPIEIGRASCRERVCHFFYIPVVAVFLKKTFILPYS